MIGPLESSTALEHPKIDESSTLGKPLAMYSVTIYADLFNSYLLRKIESRRTGLSRQTSMLALKSL